MFLYVKWTIAEAYEENDTVDSNTLYFTFLTAAEEQVHM